MTHTPLNILLIPVGSSGDVNPFVGLGVVLKRRGHRVTVATSAYFEPLIRREGLEFEPLGTKEEFTALLDHPDLWHPLRCFEFIARQITVRGVRPIYRVVEKQYVPGKTVVVASCLVLGAKLAHEKLGVPFVSVHLQPGVLRTETDPPTLPVLNTLVHHWRWALRLLYRVADWRMDGIVLPELNGFRKELGLAPVRQVMTWWHSPQRIIGFFPDWFTSPQPDWPPHVSLVGFPLYDGFEEGTLGTEVGDFLRVGTPPVVFAPGSANRQAAGFFRESAQICQQLGERGVFLTRFPEQVPSNLSPTIRAFNYVPLSRLLPKSRALVHHGGIGTTAQALAAGVPQLITPLAHDQPDNAERADRLGVAKIISPRNYNVKVVVSAIRSLLNNSETEAHCQAIAARFRGSHPFETASDLIENLIK